MGAGRLLKNVMAWHPLERKKNNVRSKTIRMDEIHGIMVEMELSEDDWIDRQNRGQKKTGKI